MSRYVPVQLRRLVEERAERRCEYCLFPKSSKIVKHEIEHILPVQHVGETEAGNLALACIKCNRYKGPNIAGYDLQTGDLTPLFNPRKDVWTQHFQIDEDGIIES